MKKISVFNLKPGMVTGESVLDFNRQLIMERGTSLTENSIRRLQAHNILAVAVEDSPLTEGIAEYRDPLLDLLAEDEEEKAPTAEQISYSQRIRSSEEYKQFRENYDLNIESFKSVLNNVVEKNVDLDVGVLLQDTLNTVSNVRGGNLGVLDMLHNMREYDDSTFAHSMNVALICNVLATWIKLTPEEIEMATACGLFHDIGKLLVNQSIITKPGKLTDTEYSEIQNHTINGYKILKEQNVDTHIMNAALMHHERFDGTGYPLKLRGDQIDKYARLVAVADVYDAMTAARCYRGALCPFRVIEMFEEEGFQRYDVAFLLPFLENVVNTYIQNSCLLSDGRKGIIVFVNRAKLSRPIVDIDGKYVNLADDPNLTIEALI